jgi:hypothetical protein
MIDNIRYLNNSFGLDSGLKFQEVIPIRDLDTENKQLKQIVEVQKSELQRLRRLLGQGLLHREKGADNDSQSSGNLS